MKKKKKKNEGSEGNRKDKQQFELRFNLRTNTSQARMRIEPSTAQDDHETAGSQPLRPSSLPFLPPSSLFDWPRHGQSLTN